VKLPALAMLGLLAVTAAGAQPLPAGVALITFKEKLNLGKGCEAYDGEGLMFLTLNWNGSFEAHTDAGVFSGELVPAESRGRWWKLRLDDASLALYRLYLETGASVLCERPVSIESGTIESFALRLRRRGTIASLTLRTLANGSNGAARHLIRGRGTFVRDLHNGAPYDGRGVVILTYHLGAITGL
jgi:hypothetical protein